MSQQPTQARQSGHFQRSLHFCAPALALIAAAFAGCASSPHDGASSPPDTASSLHDSASRQESAPDAASTDACRPAPLERPLFLRGEMTNWALDDDYTFQYHCNGYLLNVRLDGSLRFRITDAGASAEATFGGAHGQVTPVVERQPLALRKASEDGGASDLQFAFRGEQTIHLRLDAGGANPQIEIGAKDFADPADMPVTDPVALGVAFDSRSPHDKSPFGAIVPGSEVDYGLTAPHGVTRASLVIERRRLDGPQEVLDYREIARIPMQRSGSADRDRWRASYRFGETGVYGYYFEIETGADTFLYQNNHDSIYWTREKGSGGLGRIEGPSDPLHRIRRFRQTVYRADYAVPAWAKDTVFYYIFPERFRNGDPGNDPRPGPNTFHDQSLEVHRNWLDKPWLPRSGDGSDDLYGNDFFGGDLAGITQKLDYIAALGANALYLTPIFRAVSNHKYDAADYRHVDPHFGRDDEFTQLAHAAKQRGIRVILDASLNHTGSDSIYFDRYGKYPGLGAFEGGRMQPRSEYADWYTFDARQSDPERQYRGWAGSRDLPEVNKASPSFRAFAFGAADSVMKRWLDRGAAGWRMDVAPWVPDDFWREWRAAVKAHRADALTIAETQFEASKFFLGDEFDSTMNYIFRNAVEDYANGKDARTIYGNIELMRELYPPPAFFALMNLLSTHDSPRALFDFGWRDEHAGAATIARAKQRLRLAVFFQMTFPGAPAIFYGDEVGVTGGEDPFDRATYPWADRGGKPDARLLADYKRLIRLRREHPLLRHGDIAAPAYIDANVIVLIRHDGARWAVVAMNNDTMPHNVSLALPAGLQATSLVDALTGKRSTVGHGSIELTVPALFGTVLENR